MVYLELQKCFGSDASVGGIKFQFATRIKADFELIKNARAKGIDCKDIKLSWADQASIGGKGTQLCFAFCSAFRFVLHIPFASTAQPSGNTY